MTTKYHILKSSKGRYGWMLISIQYIGVFIAWSQLLGPQNLWLRCTAVIHLRRYVLSIL
jgi:hypothetical protein